MGGNCSLGLNASNPDAKRIAGWAKVPGAMLQCYPQFDWRDEFAPVVGGGANADGSATLKTGAGISGDIKPLARFIGMNMLSELDAPHEYYIDAGQQRLFFYPPTPLAQWGSADQLVISRNQTAIALQGVTDVRIKDLTVVSAASGGITAAGVNRTTISSCNVHSCGGTGITLSGWDSGVEGCEVWGVGGAGVHVGGGDVPTLAPGNNYVRRSSIHH